MSELAQHVHQNDQRNQGKEHPVSHIPVDCQVVVHGEVVLDVKSQPELRSSARSTGSSSGRADTRGVWDGYSSHTRYNTVWQQGLRQLDAESCVRARTPCRHLVDTCEYVRSPLLACCGP